MKRALVFTLMPTNPKTSRRAAIRCTIPGLAIALVTSIACSSPDMNGPTGLDPAQSPWTLLLNAHAITLSTDTANNGRYSTLALTAKVQGVDGTPLAGIPVTFSSSDSSVRVSSTGMLTARRVNSNIQIIASAVSQGIRVSDTAVVTVTAAAAPTFQQLRLHLQPGDSSTIAAPNLFSRAIGIPINKTLEVGAIDATGAQIPETIVALRVSNAWQASFDFYDPIERITTTANAYDVYIPLSSRVGVPVTVYASATVYGISREDSLRLMVTPELLFMYKLVQSTTTPTSAPTFAILPTHQEVIGIGGYVWWANTTPDSLDVVFDDPTAASPDQAILQSGGGNIAPFPGGDPNEVGLLAIVRARQFLRAGTFRWHSVRTGVSGMVVVQ